MNQPNLRPDLARHLRQRLQAFGEGFRQNLAMLGPPGSGKTFQLQQLLAERPPHIAVVYCALYRESCRSFVHRLLCAILQAGVPPSAEGSGGSVASDQPLETLLEHAQRTLPKTVAAMRPIQELVSRRLIGEAFTRTLDTIPLLAEERGRPCALILDEFLFLEELGLVHAFHELGKRVMTWPSTLFLLTSSSCHRARTILRERLQLLFGQFELVTLDTLDPATATVWIRQELRGIKGATEITPFFLQWLGAYPWYLAVMLKRLRELSAIGRRPIFTPYHGSPAWQDGKEAVHTAKGSSLRPPARSGVPGRARLLVPFDAPSNGISRGTGFTESLFLQTAWDVLGSPEGTLHQWCVSRTEGLARERAGGRALEALVHIANGARTTTEIGNRIGRAALSAALQLLVERDLATRNGTCWVITDPILRCWLSTIFTTQRSDPHVNSPTLRDRFERHIRTLWTQWMQANARSFADQVVGLFRQFSDETVSLDSKTGRLPKFDTVRTQPPDAAVEGTYLVALGQGKRWCATVQEQPIDEQTITHFETFCRTQAPKPSRKIVISNAPLDQHAKLVAKAANMWVWEPDDLHLLMGLYGHL